MRELRGFVRRSIHGLLASTLVLAVAGCGGEAPAPQEKTPVAKPEAGAATDKNPKVAKGQISERSQQTARDRHNARRKLEAGK